MSGVGGHVHRRRPRLQRGEEVGDREGRPPVLSDHDGRDSLTHGGQRGGFGEEAPVVVAVGVDEPRREHQPRSIVDLFGVEGRQGRPAGAVGRHLGDGAAHDSQRPGESGAAGTVHDGGPADQEGVLAGGNLCPVIAAAGHQQKHQDVDPSGGGSHAPRESAARDPGRSLPPGAVVVLRLAHHRASNSSSARVHRGQTTRRSRSRCAPGSPLVQVSRAVPGSIARRRRQTYG